MERDNIIIFSIIVLVISAIITGVIMGNRSYHLPYVVENIDETIEFLNSESDEKEKMYKLYVYNEISRSNKIVERETGKIKKFSEDDMNEFYSKIGGREAIIEFLKKQEKNMETRYLLETACYDLKIITSEELDDIWKNK